MSEEKPRKYVSEAWVCMPRAIPAKELSAPWIQMVTKNSEGNIDFIQWSEIVYNTIREMLEDGEKSTMEAVVERVEDKVGYKLDFVTTMALYLTTQAMSSALVSQAQSGEFAQENEEVNRKDLLRLVLLPEDRTDGESDKGKISISLLDTEGNNRLRDIGNLEASDLWQATIAHVNAMRLKRSKDQSKEDQSKEEQANE